MLLIGTRPEAIKLAPLSAALSRRGIDHRLWTSGQHPGLDLSRHGFDRSADLDLGCKGRIDPFDHARAVSAALAPHLAGHVLLVVQGDTSTALGGARAASASASRLAHVEAGLRTHDLRSPWPEEAFRVEIDRQADLLFAPTVLSAAHLRREGVRGSIHVTGNTIVDALAAIAPGTRPPHDGRPASVLVTCHRRESWGEGLASIAAAVRTLCTDDRLQCTVILHPNPVVSTAMVRALGDVAGATLMPPASHRDMVARMAASDLILSDSGGIQEEAPVLGIPLLVLRDRSERPEGIAEGSVRLVGTDCDSIVDTVRRLVADPRRLARMRRRCLPQGGPGASERIADILASHVHGRMSMDAGIARAATG